MSQEFIKPSWLSIFLIRFDEIFPWLATYHFASFALVLSHQTECCIIYSKMNTLMFGETNDVLMIK